MVERRRREGRPRYFARRKVCNFCVDKIAQIDYKDVNRLRRYLSEWSRIDSRRKSGTCARHQRQLSDAVKRARHLALLPFTADHIRTAER
jgi:small subunit ribosomal protein S18